MSLKSVRKFTRFVLFVTIRCFFFLLFPPTNPLIHLLEAFYLPLLRVAYIAALGGKSRKGVSAFAFRLTQRKAGNGGPRGGRVAGRVTPHTTPYWFAFGAMMCHAVIDSSLPLGYSVVVIRRDCPPSPATFPFSSFGFFFSFIYSLFFLSIFPLFFSLFSWPLRRKTRTRRKHETSFLRIHISHAWPATPLY